MYAVLRLQLLELEIALAALRSVRLLENKCDTARHARVASFQRINSALRADKKVGQRHIRRVRHPPDRLRASRYRL